MERKKRLTRYHKFNKNITNPTSNDPAESAYYSVK